MMIALVGGKEKELVRSKRENVDFIKLIRRGRKCLVSDKNIEVKCAVALKNVSKERGTSSDIKEGNTSKKTVC